ncbi:MAG TPA: apolipoprotein N-acyltransferase [Terriglobales bacterium]
MPSPSLLKLQAPCYPATVRQIHSSAWRLVLLSAALQILIFPLPNLYFLCWIALAPLLVALLRTRPPQTLQLREAIKLLPATPLQGFVLGYACGILWYAGTCYWIFSVMHQYGELNTPAAFGILILFCLYLGLYHGAFGLLISLLARGERPGRMPLLMAPAAWVAVELARTRITGFPWDLLGITQVDNIPMARLATVAGVYGLSFEVMLVNVAIAAAFLIRWPKRKPLLMAWAAAVVVLQSARWIPAPAFPADQIAFLVQPNISANENWTKPYFLGTLEDLTQISMPAKPGADVDAPPHPDLIVWPEAPMPFFTNDPVFRNQMSDLAKQANAWVLAGSIGVRPTPQNAERPSEMFNSASLVSPTGDWTARYDKIHLVPFGEYVPFEQIFSFASGLTKEVGQFSRGASRMPLDTGNARLGVFICYESIFPDEVRQTALNGAQVFVNISNDGWYGDSGAYAQHLRQARMRAVENSRWLLRDTNTGVTASIDPYGRVVASIPRKIRSKLIAPYALADDTTFYTRHGDWFAFLCAIILVVALLRLPFATKAQS